MDKKLNIVIVGLPVFAKRLKNDLSTYCSHWNIIHLDTYYSRLDKIKALLIIPKADLLFSINGSITKSKIFDLAFAFKVKVIMNWVGTDVLDAINAKKTGVFNQKYIENATHHCEVSWIAHELKEIGIKANVLNFASFDKTFPTIIPSQAQFNILAYISQKRAVFYGMDSLLNLAKKFPAIKFTIVGNDGSEYSNKPNNVKMLGWVSEMDSHFDQAHLCFRFPSHDGLSNFVLEALARGKHVLYNYPFENCLYCPTELDLERTIAEKFKEFNNNLLQPNLSGKAFIESNFNQNTILENLSKTIYAISKG